MTKILMEYYTKTQRENYKELNAIALKNNMEMYENELNKIKTLLKRNKIDFDLNNEWFKENIEKPLRKRFLLK